MNKCLKKFFYNNCNELISVAILATGIYIARLVARDELWAMHDIQYCALDEDISLEEIYGKLQDLLEKYNHQKLPLFISLPNKIIETYVHTFPNMSEEELIKAVHWRAKENVDIKNKYYAYERNENEVKIYFIEKTIVERLTDICQKVNFRLAGVFPLLAVEIIRDEEDRFIICLHKRKVNYTLSNDDKVIPDYAAALMQNVIKCNTEFELLPQNEKMSIFNWQNISIAVVAVNLIIAIVLFLFFYYSILQGKDDLAQQKQQLQKMETASKEKLLLEQADKNIKQRKEILLKMKPEKMQAYALLTNIGSVSIDAVWLTTLTMDEKNNITIEGNSLDYDALEEYMAALKKYYFPDLVLAADENNKEDSTIKFTLKIQGKSE